MHNPDPITLTKESAPNFKWWAFGAIAVGTFISVVGHGSVLVALPSIAEHFNTDLPTVQWVIIVETLAIAVLLLPMGRLGDQIGRRKVYLVGFSIFILSAAVAGSPWWSNFPTLLIAKLGQGIGSAMLQGNAVAMILSAFTEKERGKALGSNLSVVGLGSIIGPALGGVLVSLWGWKSIFWINIPAGILAMIATIIILKGTNLGIANFEQDKGSLNMDASLQENLAGDPEIALPGRADQILVKGIPRHVAGYLKEFLFDPSALRAPVRSLSGGEKSRLILAKLMAKKSNLLLLDEPTNDLDIETLDLLQEILCEYDGTIILISHDRDFVEQVATRVLFFEGNGKIIDFTGGYRSYLNNRSVDKSRKNTDRKSVKSKTMMDSHAKKKNVNLSFTDHHRLREIPREVERLELEIKKLEDFLSIDDLYLSDQKKFDKKKFEELLLKISKKDEDYVAKKENLKKLNYQNTWNNVNQNLLGILNEN